MSFNNWIVQYYVWMLVGFECMCKRFKCKCCVQVEPATNQKRGHPPIFEPATVGWVRPCATSQLCRFKKNNTLDHTNFKGSFLEKARNLSRCNRCSKLQAWFTQGALFATTNHCVWLELHVDALHVQLECYVVVFRFGHEKSFHILKRP